MTVAELHRTPLHAEHLKLNAQMVPFGGWSMPLQYTSIRAEHLAVRQAAGLFDLSHMGEVVIRGPHALPALQYLVTNDVSRLRSGRAQYNLLCNPEGGILDDLLVYVQSDQFLLVVNASNQFKDFEWIQQQVQGKADVELTSFETALIGIQGPRARAILQPLTQTPLDPIRYYAFAAGQVASVPCLLSRTGYTGEDGFELFCAASDATRLWNALLDAGQEAQLQPAGLGARDTLRLEAGMRLYGNDLDAQTNPFEASLDWTVKLEKGDFIGRAALQRVKDQGVRRRCVGLRLLERGIPRHGYRVLHDGREVGVVSSGNVSFTLGYSIAMAYVPPELAVAGKRLQVDIRGIPIAAEVVDLPFYRRAQSN